MPKKDRKKKKKVTIKQYEAPSLLHIIYKYRMFVSWIIVASLALFAFYIRIIPAQKHGLELHANDPWIMYWATDYLVHHGILSWFTLTQDNPATHIFWYPWGRDFVHSEYPLTMFITALTYPIGRALGLSVKGWSALIPPIFGSLIVITAYILARELGGELAGIFAALFTAVIPGTYERTVVGFIEKEAIALPFLLLGLFFIIRGFRKESILHSSIGGLLIGLIAWTWGGYQVVYLLIGGSLALIPFFHRIRKRELVSFLFMIIIASILSITSPVVGVLKTLKGAGLFLFAGYLLLAIGYILQVKEESNKWLERIGSGKAYLGILLLIIASGILLIVSGNLAVSGRALYFLGKHAKHPLVASVAEHQAPSLTYLFSQTGTPILLSVVYLLWAVLFKLRKDSSHIFLVLPVLLMLYVTSRASYLIQSGSTILSVGGALALAPVSSYLIKSLGIGSKGKRRSIDTLGATLWSTAIVVVLLLGILHAHTTIAEADSIVPSIKAGGLGLPVENDAWVKALNILANQTEKDAVIVAWWDYGYWISVGAHRATVADGATLNSTQISLLAKALTAKSESEALDILYNKLHTPVNKTYIVIFDVFRSYKSGGSSPWLTGPYVSLASGTEGMGDIPKSIWMLRIAGRMGLYNITPYFRLVKIPVGAQRYGIVLEPAWNTTLVQRTLIYRLFIYGVETLGYTQTPGCTNMTGNHIFIDWATAAGGRISGIMAQPFKHIKPYKTAVGCLFDGQHEKLYVAVFIFKVQ